MIKISKRNIIFLSQQKAVTSQLPPSYSEKTLVLPNIYYQKEINIHDTATKRLEIRTIRILSLESIASVSSSSLISK